MMLRVFERASRIAAPPMARKLSNEGVYKNYFTELAEHDDDSDEDRK